MSSGLSGENRERGFAGELKDAVTARAALLVIGVLLLQFGFIISYVGALHHPYPHRASIAVAAPAQVSDKLVAQLNGLPKKELDARPVGSAADARREVLDQKAYSALVVDPNGTKDTLLVANARGPVLATAIQQIVTSAESSQGRTLATEDLVPLASGDADGLSSFYLVVGWCVGGYLVASILGISAGSRPATFSRALIRVGVLALYSVVAGIGGAVIIGPVLNALPGSILGLWGVGALLVFAVGVFTMALECLFGVVGIGLAVLVFVVLGNPSAGGVFPPPMIPAFWRAIGPWLPNGAATTVTRSIAYFGGTQITGPLLVLAVWAVLGTAIALVFTRMRPGRDSATGAPAM